MNFFEWLNGVNWYAVGAVAISFMAGGVFYSKGSAPAEAPELPIVRVKIIRTYGTDRIYPACSTAAILCKLANQKTLSPHHLETIKQLGYRVHVAGEVL